jgi:hypothetical protein
MPMVTLEAAATRLAHLLIGGGTMLVDPGQGGLEFADDLTVRPLVRREPPVDAWAVDGGQAQVVDARCLELVITRAARVRFQKGACVLEDEGELFAHLLGGREGWAAVAALDLGVASDTSLEGVVHLLRDAGEWRAVGRCLVEAKPGAVVLVDGDLVPDWRIPSRVVAHLLARAQASGVLLAGVTKHSSLARGGAPLLGQLELEAQALFGPRATWWAPVAHTRPDLVAEGSPGLQVVAARLDPDARFAFRVDLPAEADPEEALGTLSALCDDAGFPGYPYPLTVADRLAACPPWLRQEIRMLLDDHLDRAGVPLEVRERAFADRHSAMERV